MSRQREQLGTWLIALGAACAVVACTTANPLYTPSLDADLGTQTDGSQDLSTLSTNDLAMTTVVDLASPAQCMPEARACLALGSAGCVGGVLSLDRTCPQGSTCADGYCQAPPVSQSGVGKSCFFADHASEAYCIVGGVNTNTPSCMPYVEPVAGGGDPDIVWRCTRPVGAGVPGTPCTAGTSCRSGYCGSNGTCFRACASGADCLSSGSGSMKCAEVDIVVEGVELTAASCIPD